MIAKIISGKNIQGALNYNEQKVAQNKAELIQANGFLKDHALLNFYEKLSAFTDLNERNARSGTNTIHISLNFDPSENPSVDALNQIASTYMDKIGFGDQPYLVYRHDDSAHPHIHIVSTLIQSNGKRIPIHYLGKNESETARKEIEKEFGLVQAMGRSKELMDQVSPGIEKPIYGKTQTKASIVKVVRSVTRTYKYTSLAELNAVLRLYNVTASRGSEKSQMFLNKGLHYSILDANGNRVGVPIKASSISGKPTLLYLEKQFKINEALRQKFREPLKRVVDAALSLPGTKTRQDFVKALDSQNIKVIFRTNPEGKTYGITFVDQGRKGVFNGSDLGKSYGAAGILGKLSIKLDALKPALSTIRRPQADGLVPTPINQDPTTGSTLIDIVFDLTNAESNDFASPENALKLRKKKRRRKPKGS